MPTRSASIPNRRAIVDRRALADALSGASRSDATAILRDALAAGRAEIARRLEEKPWQGTETASAYAFLTDQILRLVHDVALAEHPSHNPTDAERLLVMAVGGYGRGEMALHSDVDLAFVTPWKPTGWAERMAESMLYLLWDLKLKVGQSIRSADELVRMASSDHTVKTALLESRYVWGDEALFDAVQARFRREVVAGDVPAFVTVKLEERNERHRRL